MDSQQSPDTAARILIVDDSPKSRLLIESVLHASGYAALAFAESAEAAFRKLGLEGEPNAMLECDLVLMDFLMPDIDGIQACRRIKADPRFLDIPVIMVTAEESVERLNEAFEAGATDYVNKPVNRVELMARVKCALRLKQETDCRKAREQELVRLTVQLERLSAIDGLTGIANRRTFDEELGRAWRQAQREATPVSLILLDIDHFKSYNDCYGHLAGDDCLRRVAQALRASVNRTFDLVARYGGEEFAVVLPATPQTGAEQLARAMCKAIESLHIAHSHSTAGHRVTISSGVATVIPALGAGTESLIAMADACLYEAKRGGRNRVVSGPAELSLA